MLRGYPAFHFICIGNRCFKRDLLFRCSCSVWAVAHLGLDQLCGKRTALPHPAGLWLYIPWLQQGGGIKAEWNRFSAVSPVCFSWFHQRNKKEQIEKKKKRFESNQSWQFLPKLDLKSYWEKWGVRALTSRFGPNPFIFHDAIYMCVLPCCCRISENSCILVKV